MNKIIAIDGPAAAGKGVLAHFIATEYGFYHLDTGLTYRAVAKIILESGIELNDEAAIAKVAKEIDLSNLNKEMRSTHKIANTASEIAVMPAVRRALVKIQRIFSLKKPGTVLDGRDIGTVVCPNARVKFYITASLEIRARRRYTEMISAGMDVDYTTIYESIRQRDKRDQHRVDSPLAQDKDAYFFDTSKTTIETMFKFAKRLIDTKLN